MRKSINKTSRIAAAGALLLLSSPVWNAANVSAAEAASNAGALHPERIVTRAEFAAMANRAFGLVGAPANAASAFRDTPAGKWYARDLWLAASAGYMTGYADGTMRPLAPVTRQQAAVMLARLSKLEADGPAASASEFRDGDKIGGWSRDAVRAAVANGIFATGADGAFGPDQPLTRQAAADALDRTVAAAQAAGLFAPPTSGGVKIAPVLYDQAGTYGPADSTQTIAGDVSIGASGIVLRNLIVEGDLIAADGMTTGELTLRNVQVKGKLAVAASERFVVLADGSKLASIETGASGSAAIELRGGSSANQIRIRAASSLSLDASSSVEVLQADAAVRVTGSGTVGRAILNAPGSTFEQAPKQAQYGSANAPTMLPVVSTVQPSAFPAPSYVPPVSTPTPEPGNGSPSPGGGSPEPGTPGNEPPIPVSGVASGGVYESYVTPQAQDRATLVGLTLNDETLEDYALGDELTAAGNYVLTVRGADGRTSAVSFSLVSKIALDLIDDEIHTSYDSESGQLMLPVHISNTGADQENAVNGVKLTIEGLKETTELLFVDYGAIGQAPYGDFILYRVQGTDTFVGRFPESAYNLNNGWDQYIAYTVNLGTSSEARAYTVDAWISSADDSDSRLAELPQVSGTVDASPITRIEDLRFDSSGANSARLTYTLYGLYDDAVLEQSTDGGESWSSASFDHIWGGNGTVNVSGLQYGQPYRFRIHLQYGSQSSDSNEVQYTPIAP